MRGMKRLLFVLFLMWLAGGLGYVAGELSAQRECKADMQAVYDLARGVTLLEK